MLSTLRRIPWHTVDDLKYRFRNRFARTSWKESRPSITVECTHDELKAHFERAHFEDASGFSLKYSGEILNMRRPAGYSDEYDHDRELHVRTRDGEHGPEIIAHTEANRYTEKHDHVEEIGLEWLNHVELSQLVDHA